MGTGIYLRDNASSIGNRLLDSYGRCTAIVGSDVNIDPGDIETWAVVYGDGTEECCEVFDSVGRDREEDNVAGNAEDIGEEDELLSAD
jgi:hypothetical protein